MSKALRVVLEECQRFADQVPLKRRAALYRGLAEVCGSSHKGATYIALADQCDALREHEARLQIELSMEDGE